MNDHPIGTAHVPTAQECAKIIPRIDGPVLEATLEVLRLNSGLTVAALETVRDQAAGLLVEILTTYDASVAKGEVGPTGSGKASSAPPLDRPATGLLYGRVQSGKTLTMITTTAMALDNGFRVVVVLTSDNVNLVRQTATRFRGLHGVIVKDSTDIGSWLDDGAHVSASIGEAGLVLILAKNTSHLKTFVDFLQEVGAPGYPALILDDEADQASLDTNTNARAQAKKKGKSPPSPSTIASKTSEGGEGVSIRGTLPHHLYLQVTATPYALLLQSTESNFRPMFTNLMQPGAGYTGGDFFFSRRAVDEEGPPLVYVSEEECRSLQDKRIPDGIARSIGCFLVAAAAQGLTDKRMRLAAQNYLCHVSMRKSDHGRVAGHVRDYLQLIIESLRGDRAYARTILELGAREMRKTVDLPDPVDIENYVFSRLKDRELKVVNSEQDDANFGARLNFIIGGNILGRGITIDNLLVTYYVRTTKIAQMDTMLQHARMFGYRDPIKCLMRVYIPEVQALRFHSIQESELALRAFLSTNSSSGTTPVHVDRSQQLRPTRTNVLDPDGLTAWIPGQHLYPLRPYHGNDARACHAKTLQMLEELFPSKKFEKLEIANLPEVPIDEVVKMLPRIPVDDCNAGNWDPRAIVSVLNDTRKLFGDSMYLYARKASRKTLSQGNLGGAELSGIRNHGAPVLCIFYDDACKLELGKCPPIRFDFPYVFPEFVFPQRDRGGNALPVFVFENGARDGEG